MPKTRTKSKLTGEKLLKKVEELKHLSKAEKAIACGYSLIDSDGMRRVKMIEFLNALLDAEGINVDGKQSAGGGGKPPAFRVRVHKSGNILVSSSYTKKLGLEPGDPVTIELGQQRINLIPTVNG